jgi:DNA-binding response OmpR family regulator
MQRGHAPLHGLSILFITDHSHIGEPLGPWLRSAGAVVIGVRTTALALAYSERHSVDAVLVDLREAGWWSTFEIRALRALTRVPVYALTEPSDAIPDASAGLAGYFPKPVRADTLIGTLSELPRRE